MDRASSGKLILLCFKQNQIALFDVQRPPAAFRGHRDQPFRAHDDQPFRTPPGFLIVIGSEYAIAITSERRFSSARNDNFHASESAGWTLTNMDKMGRPTTVWRFTGSTAPVCGEGNALTTTGHSATTYDQVGTIGGKTGNITDVTDERSNTRRTFVDGLGRMIGVAEDPGGFNYQTSYAYNALDELTSVTQGTQSRTFNYDSLKRLTSSYHPEMNPAGTSSTLAASYTYTNDGLVKTRTDGNGAVTTYTYDGLNRVLTKTYSGTAVTPAVTFCYDGRRATADGQCTAGTIAYSHGRLTESRSNLSGQSLVSLTTYTAFDELGRMTASQQTTNGTAYPFTYQYDLANALTSMTYPFGRTVSTTYDDAGRATAVTLMVSGSASTRYAAQGTYAAHGGLSSMTLGNSVIPQTWTYNSRLQLSGVSVGPTANPLLSLSLDYGGATNNGNPASQTMTRSGAIWEQVYRYDAVNRLTIASEHATNPLNPACPDAGSTWCKTYGHDAVGNTWLSAHDVGFTPDTFTPTASSNFDGGNHLGFPTLTSYDLAGNQTQRGGSTFAYDAEGRIESSTINGATTVYVYDAEGRRVMKRNPSGTSVTYVYDAFGQLAAEYNSSGVTATPVCATSTCYVAQDHLGSTRLVANSDGTAYGCHDFAPYGEELAGAGGRSGGCWGAVDTELKFTGKERDAETGLDFFGARYMSSAQGRFTSPDPLSGTLLHVLNPQRWNMYAYAVNNPLAYTDPDGRDAIAVVYSKMAVHMGHAGVASVHADGRGTYADFGPKNGPRPIGAGKYNFIDYKTQIQYGADGRPTTESLTALANELADDEKQPNDSVSVYYFKTSDAETAALDAFINQAKNRQSAGDVPYYVTGISDCIGFCAAGLRQAHVDSGAPFFSIPNLYTLDFILNERSEGQATGTNPPKPKERVKSKICYTDDNGNKVCQQ